MIERRRMPEVRAERDGQTLTGYAVLFNRLSLDLGGFVEKVDPGAFRESLQKRPDVALLHSHDPARPLARTIAGTLSVYEDRRGLAFEATLPNSAEGRHIGLLVERGEIRGMSIAFMVHRAQDESWAGDRPGNVIRVLHRVTLLEASTVVWPAYPSTSVSVAEAMRGTSARDRRLALKRRELGRRLARATA